MLKDFMDKQPFAYNLFSKEILSGNLSHAYLIDENNFSESYSMVMAFVKSILCPNVAKNGTNCNECKVCKSIDDNNYPEVMVVEPDGISIKKQQIIDLQQKFSRSAIEGHRRVYIIRDCDKMRIEASNSMLKFLEEPEDNIIAILMTNNINNVLPTIISRCQIIKLNNDNIARDDDGVKEIAINFINALESEKLNTFLRIDDIWFSHIGTKERDKIIVTLDIMIDLYYDVLKILVGNTSLKYKSDVEWLNEIANNNNSDKILKKISFLLEAKDAVKLNVNSNLLIDNIIISIGGGL